MKLKDFTYGVYLAILDIYTEVCGGTGSVKILKNETKYNALLSEFKTRSSVERRLGSNICSQSKLWFNLDSKNNISFSFASNLSLSELKYLAEKEKEMEEKFNAKISDFLQSHN